MKPLHAGEVKAYIQHLYPTTFRWNSKRRSQKKPCRHIYIPLRSDETIALGRNMLVQNHLYPTTFRWNQAVLDVDLHPVLFISHYVQMKLSSLFFFWMRKAPFISHYVQMKRKIYQPIAWRRSNLYPTTFRWNCFARPRSARHMRIYIPLRSDETHSYTHSKMSDTYLYPTTFRWNAPERRFLFGVVWWFISHYVQMKRSSPDRRRSFCRIYIPLRSDETDPADEENIPWEKFISHYVQMKPGESASKIVS